MVTLYRLLVTCIKQVFRKCASCNIWKKGMGQNTCLQMIYSIVTVYKRIKQEGGIALLDEIQAMAMRRLKQDGNGWQKEGGNNNPKALSEVMDTFNSENEQSVTLPT